MSKERYDTSKLASNIASLEYNEFVDLVNYCGEQDEEIWDYLMGEIIRDDYLTDNGKNFLKLIACHILDEDVCSLMNETEREDIKRTIKNWWSDLWGECLWKSF